MKRIDELRQRLDAVLDEFNDVPLEEIADELDYRASEYQRKANLSDCQQ